MVALIIYFAWSSSLLFILLLLLLITKHDEVSKINLNILIWFMVFVFLLIYYSGPCMPLNCQIRPNKVGSKSTYFN